MANIVINVGRQLGSGGRTIGKLLSEELSCQFFDKKILNLAAKESGFSEKYFEKNDEKRGFFRNFFNISMPHVGYNNMYNNQFSQEGLFLFQSEAIKKAAHEQSCVFVGRCADYVLREFPNVLNVFITANLDDRIKRVSQYENVSEEQAHKLILEKESNRADYYNYYTGKKWGSAESYDLCINSSILGIEETAKYIAEFAKDYFKL